MSGTGRSGGPCNGLASRDYAMRGAEAQGYPARRRAQEQRRPAAAPAPPDRSRPLDGAEHAGGLSALNLVQAGCALGGTLALLAAAIIDAGFVRSNLAADGVMTASQAAALPAARLALAGLGAALLLLALLLPRLIDLAGFAGPAGRRRLEWAAFLTPPALLAGLVGYKLVRGAEDQLYLLAVREDSLVESLT